MEERGFRSFDAAQAPNQPPLVSEEEQEKEFTPPPLRARHVYLRPITPNDYGFLRMLETAGEPAARWRHRGVGPSPEQWVHTLWEGVLVQFLVIGITSDKPIGRVMIYQPNFQDRYAYFAALRFEPRAQSPLMILGIALFLRYVFTYWEFEKLYMEVPEYNFGQIASGLGRFFEIEGRLRGHFRMGGHSWDQLILAVYRRQAIERGERLRLDYGRRSVVDSEPTAGAAQDQLDGVDPGRARREISWEGFVAEVAQIANVPPERVGADTRILEDLALDSLALAELGVVLVDKYDLWSLSKQLETRTWTEVTARDLFEECLTKTPAQRPPGGNGEAAL